MLVRFTTVSRDSHRKGEGTIRRHQEVIRTLDVRHWPTLAWNTVHHHLAQQPESWEWSAKRFFEAAAAYAHLGTTAQRSFKHIYNPSGTPPKPLWYDTPFGKEDEDAFSMESLRPQVAELGEQIADQLEG